MPAQQDREVPNPPSPTLQKNAGDWRRLGVLTMQRNFTPAQDGAGRTIWRPGVNTQAGDRHMVDPLREPGNRKLQDDDDNEAEAEFAAAASDTLQAADSDDTDDVFADMAKFEADNAVNLDVPVAKTTYPLRRPHPDELFRVHPDEAMCKPVWTYRQQGSGKIYYVEPAARPFMEGLCRISRVVMCCTGDNEIIVWPVTMPREGNSNNVWYDDAWAAVLSGRKVWSRIVSIGSGDGGPGGYKLYIAAELKREPEWPPGETFQTLMKKAFKGASFVAKSIRLSRRFLGKGKSS